MWMDDWVLNLPVKYWPKFSSNNGLKIPFLFRFFETQKNIVVLSSSNKPEKETHEDLCQKYQVPLLRRQGGGGTVVLGPGCLILTFAFYAKDFFSNAKYFYLINDCYLPC